MNNQNGKITKAQDEHDVKYYILFDNYTHGFALQAILKEEGVSCRIAPAPRAIQGDLTCGMSLLIEPVDLPAVEEVIDSYDLSRKTGGAEKCDPVTRLNSSEPSAQTHDSEAHDSHDDTENRFLPDLASEYHAEKRHEDYIYRRNKA